MKESFLNKPIKVLLITDGLVLLAAAMFVPIYAVYVEKIGGDLLDVGLTGGILCRSNLNKLYFRGRPTDASRSGVLKLK